MYLHYYASNTAQYLDAVSTLLL